MKKEYKEVIFKSIDGIFCEVCSTCCHKKVCKQYEKMIEMELIEPYEIKFNCFYFKKNS